MGILDWVALIIVLIVLVKLVVLATKPAAIGRLAEVAGENAGKMRVGLLIVGAGVLLLLLRELTIVEIIAASVFGLLIMALTLFSFEQEVKTFYRSIVNRGNILRRAALPFLIWILLSAWILYALFVA